MCERQRKERERWRWRWRGARVSKNANNEEEVKIEMQKNSEGVAPGVDQDQFTFLQNLDDDHPRTSSVLFTLRAVTWDPRVESPCPPYCP